MVEPEDEIASIFAAGDEIGGLMPRVDWASTALGHPETWPQSLRSALSICLGSRFPICLYWGAEYVLLYNDAWIALQGGKHPWALGRAAAEVWPESWNSIKPVFDAVTASAEGVWAESAGLAMLWNDRGEHKFRLACGPVRGEGGAVVGLFGAVLGTRPGISTGQSREPEAGPEVDQERSALLERLVGLHEQERLRIARELHDQMGQDLTGLSLGMKSLETFIDDERGLRALRWLQSLTAVIGSNVHRAAWELHPTSLEDVGLARALETYAADWSERYGLRLDFHARCGNAERFPSAVEIAAYRIVQEALSNVTRRAAVTTVSIVLECNDGWLQIIVEDDGKTSDPDPTAGQGATGLAGIRERLGLLGGTMSVDAESGARTTLYIRIPLGPGNREPEGGR
jgi:signal transduction histidine kinase